ncbi:uncharacterized protein [Antennarius striatus]|uniref:uncharacterized protein n=1 Tax=Antennarius striatus TaxID=241820 RepID=UPI0035B40E24
MDFILCPTMDITNLTSIARDVCPFPSYNPSPLFLNMLSINSSLHLRNHYTAVQSSLTPEQLEDFTQSLRTTFGRNGNVTLGGVGVVALSLAVLFDTLARQVRGEWVSEFGVIPGLFVKNPRNNYPPQVYTVSEYLRLVPHIANNPKRMKQETERYHKRLVTEDGYVDKLGEDHTLSIKEDITAFNLLLTHIFEVSLDVHHRRIKNTLENELVTPFKGQPKDVIFTFNCDPEAANKILLAEEQKLDEGTQFKILTPELSKTRLHEVAKLDFLNSMIKLSCAFQNPDSMVDKRDDFDLKADALRSWE